MRPVAASAAAAPAIAAVTACSRSLRCRTRSGKLIGPQTDLHTIDTAAMRGGMTTMLADAVLKCRAGLTTVPEVFRVTTIR